LHYILDTNTTECHSGSEFAVTTTVGTDFLMFVIIDPGVKASPGQYTVNLSIAILSIILFSWPSADSYIRSCANLGHIGSEAYAISLRNKEAEVRSTCVASGNNSHTAPSAAVVNVKPLMVRFVAGWNVLRRVSNITTSDMVHMLSSRCARFGACILEIKLLSSLCPTGQ
jgi:hypothetical protein